MGKKVLITGASSGIGKSFAKYFSKMGYDLVLVSRNVEKLEEVKKEIGDKVLVEVYATDISVVSNCIEIYNKFSDIDILVNNAGFGLVGDFVDIEVEKELEMINLNICAVQVLMKLYLKEMEKRNEGKILNVASIAGFLPGPLMATYYATKNYVVRISEAVNEELRKKNSKVQISVLCPGPVETNFDKIAGVDFSLKSKCSDRVVSYAINKLNSGKFYIVPGVELQVMIFFSRFFSGKFVSKIVFYQQKKKKVYK